MKKLVIVGAGPIGLIFACLLKKKGFDPIVIDPRTGPYNKEMKKGDDPTAGAYTRPTYLSKDVFDLVAKELNITFPPGALKNVQIKNLERTLYDHAKNTLKIDIRKASFVGITKKGVVVRDEVNKTLDVIPSYWVGDATGGKRLVVKALNKIAKDNPKFKTKPFEIRRIAENPVKNHFIANVRLTNQSDVRMINALAYLFFSLSGFATNRDEVANYLKEKYGWTAKSPPYFKPLVFNVDKGKAIFHYETTENLQPDQYEDFLKTLIWLKTGIKDVAFEQIETRKFVKKPRFMPFIVDPHEVVPGYFAGAREVLHERNKIIEEDLDIYDEPLFQPTTKVNDNIEESKNKPTESDELGPEDIPEIVVLGDALAQTDHRLSTAISNGIDRLELLISCSVQEKDGTLKIDYARYQFLLNTYNEFVHSELRDLYNSRRKELEAKVGEEFKENASYSGFSFIPKFNFAKNNFAKNNFGFISSKSLSGNYDFYDRYQKIYPYYHINKYSEGVRLDQRVKNEVKFDFNNVTFTIEKSNQHINVDIEYMRGGQKRYLILMSLKDLENKCSDLMKGDKKILLEYVLRLFNDEKALPENHTDNWTVAANVITDTLEAKVTNQQASLNDERYYERFYRNTSLFFQTNMFDDYLNEVKHHLNKKILIPGRNESIGQSASGAGKVPLESKLQIEIDKLISNHVDLYQILGIDKNAAQNEIKKAYKKKALELHPDKSKENAQSFINLVQAYEILSHPEARKYYDIKTPVGVADQKLLHFKKA